MFNFKLDLLQAIRILLSCMLVAFPALEAHGPSATTMVRYQATTTALASSPNPSTFGQQVTFTARVAPAAPGTVWFMKGWTKLGTATLSGGTATFSTSALGAGSSSINAVYVGATGFLGSASAALTQNVTKAASTTSLAANPTTAALGQKVKLTATVTPATSGTVVFRDGATTLGTATLSGGVATFSTTTLARGSHALTAAFAGNANVLASGASNSVSVTVTGAAASVTLSTTLPTSTFGQTVKVTATVSPVVSSTTTPTGTVTFSEGATALGTVSLSSGKASLNLSALGVGSHVITGTYSGNATYSTASGTLTLVVNKGATATTLGAAPSGAVAGQLITYTAAVAAVSPATGVPAGTVSFLDGATVLGTGTLSSGTATFSTRLAAGSHSITAVYGGNATYTGSTSANLAQTVGKGSTQAVLTTSPNPSTQGQTVTLTAMVSVLAPASGTLTGTVTFKEGANVLGTGALSGGMATLAVSSLAAGNHPLAAVYGGDANFNGATSIGVTQTVAAATSLPSVSLSSNLNPSAYGAPVTITATVAAVAPATGTPTGTVTFKDNGVAQRTVALVGGSATFAPPSLSVGNHAMTADYAGDASFSGVTSSSLGQVVSKGSTQAVLTSAPNPSSQGQSVTLTATVSVLAPAIGTPTGTVKFMDGTTVLGTGTLSGGPVTFTSSGLAGGSRSLTAVYEGDGNFNGCTSGTVTQTVMNTPSVVLTADPNPSVLGGTVTFTATVAAVAPATGTPTGTVTFKDNGVPQGTVALNGGSATFASSSLTLGSHAMTADYSGDDSFTGGTPATLAQTVGKGTAQVVVTSSPNPSNHFQNVTFTATVSAVAPAGGVPTGSVVFRDAYGNGLASGFLSRNGTDSFSTFSFTFPGLPDGNNALTAEYSGDSNFSTKISSPFTQTVLGQPTVSLTASPSPSNLGDVVTLTATVAAVAPFTAVPTGTVSFKDVDTDTVLGTATLSGGTAAFALSGLSSGSHHLTAVYGGDSAFMANTSSAVTQEVKKFPVTVSLVTDPNPSAYGSPVTLTATVAAVAGLPAPTGSVDFRDGGLFLGNVPLSGSTAIKVVSTLLGGTHANLTATYSGDATFQQTPSAPVSQTVNRVDPVAAVTFTPPSSTVGQTVTFTATVGAPTAGMATPSGSVSFYADTASGTPLATIQLSGGAASFSYAGLTPGTHTLLAVYSGNVNYKPLTASAPLVVAKATPLVAVASSLNPSASGQNVTFTATVSGGTGRPLPTGQVVFWDNGASLGSATLAAGVALLTAPLPEGDHAITASYAGDDTYLALDSAPLSQTVRAALTAVLSADRTSILPGESVNLTATFNRGTGVLDQGLGAVQSGAGAAVATGPLQATTTFTLQVTDDLGGTAQASVTVEVQAGSGSFSLLADHLDIARTDFTQTLLPDGRVFIAGGNPSNDLVEIHDPVGGTPTTYLKMLTARSKHTATLLPNGTVVLAGGYDETGTLVDYAEILDPAQAAAYPPPPANSGLVPIVNMGRVRAEHTATLLANGTVLLAGGTNGQSDLDTAELLDPTLAVPRNLDLHENSLLSARMGTARRGHTATLLANGTLVLAGGFGASFSLATAERFDTNLGNQGQFTQLPLSEARAGAAAVGLPNGELLLVGGLDANGIPMASIDHLAGGAFSPFPASLASARFLHSATLLPNGKVLVAGGISSMAFSETAEMIVPSSGSVLLGSSTSVPTPPVGHLQLFGHQAVLLPSGKVFLAGGNTGTAITQFDPQDPTAPPTVDATLALSSGGGAYQATVLHPPTGPGYTYAWMITGGTPIQPQTGVGQPLLAFTSNGTTDFQVDVLVTGPLGLVAHGRAALAPAPPAFTVTSIALGTVQSGSLTLNDPCRAAVAHPMPGWTYAWTLNGGAPVTGPTFDFTPGTLGSLVLTCVATNAAGLASPPATFTAEVGNVQTTPSVTLESTPNPSTGGQDITVTATVAPPAPSAPMPTGSVTFYDGGIAISPAIDLAVEPGGMKARFTILGGALTGMHLLTAKYSGDTNYPSVFSPELTHTVEALQPLTASLSTSSPVFHAGDTVTLTPTFTGSFTGLSGSPATLDPGVGAVTSGVGIHVTPQATTTYTLTVTDFQGNLAQASVTVTQVEGAFSLLPDTLTKARNGHTLTLLPDGRVLVAGGDLDQQRVAEIIDPTHAQATQYLPLLQARSYPTATLLPDGRVLLAGGLDPATDDDALASAEILDPALATDSYPSALAVPAQVPTLALAMARYRHTATLLPDGTVFLAGGRNAGQELGSAEILDPALAAPLNASSQSALPATLGTARFDHTATLLPDGKILLAGGTHQGSPLDSAEGYDPAQGRFTQVLMPTPKTGASAIFMPTGEVLLLGGLNQVNVEERGAYRYAAGAFEPAATLSTTRGFGAATLLPSGKVLMVGGMNAMGVPQETAEILDIQASSTLPTPGTGVPFLNGHKAVLLPSGKVFLAGGSLDKAALLFDPMEPGAPALPVPDATMTILGGDGLYTATVPAPPPGSGYAFSWSVRGAKSQSVQTGFGLPAFSFSPEPGASSIQVDVEITTPHGQHAHGQGTLTVTPAPAFTVTLGNGQPLPDPIPVNTACQATITNPQGNLTYQWSLSLGTPGPLSANPFAFTASSTGTLILTCIATDPSTGATSAPASFTATVVNPYSAPRNLTLSMPVYVPNVPTTVTASLPVGPGSGPMGVVDYQFSVNGTTSGTVHTTAKSASFTFVPTTPSVHITCVASNAAGSATASLDSAVGILSVYAGAPSGYGHVDASGALAKFTYPRGLTADETGNLYVADPDSSTLRRITPEGAVSTVSGVPFQFGSTDLPALFANPMNVAAAKDGTLFVADFGNHVVRRIDPAGTVSTLAGTTGLPGTIAFPSLLAVDTTPAGSGTSGNVYVVTSPDPSSPQSLRQIAPGGAITHLPAPSASGTWNGIQSLAVDKDGSLFVVDGATLSKLTPTPGGWSLTALILPPALPNGSPMAVGTDPAGEVYQLYRDLGSSPQGLKVVPPGGGLIALGASGVRPVDGDANSATFIAPTALSVDGAGRIYLNDGPANIIRRFDPVTNQVSTMAGAPERPGTTDGARLDARFQNPAGMAMDSSGNLFVADSANNTLRKITPDGQVSTLAGMPTTPGNQDGLGSAARFNAPNGLAVDPDGNVIMTDVNNQSVRKVSPDGTVTTLASAALNYPFLVSPMGLTVDEGGSPIIADPGSHSIVMIPSYTGTPITLAGNINATGNDDGPGLAATFTSPQAVATDIFGNLYVADTGTFTIRKLDSDGRVSTLAGQPFVQGSADGQLDPATGKSSATFRMPVALAVDAQGYVYVADQLDQTVRLISPTGVVTTIMGKPGVMGTLQGPLPAQLFSPNGLLLDPSTGRLLISGPDAILQVAYGQTTPGLGF